MSLHFKLWIWIEIDNETSVAIPPLTCCGVLLLASGHQIKNHGYVRVSCVWKMLSFEKNQSTTCYHVSMRQQHLSQTHLTCLYPVYSLLLGLVVQWFIWSVCRQIFRAALRLLWVCGVIWPAWTWQGKELVLIHENNWFRISWLELKKKKLLDSAEILKRYIKTSEGIMPALNINSNRERKQIYKSCKSYVNQEFWDPNSFTRMTMLQAHESC